jgi:spore coat polysaccharide biosynthesis predicted glycosyltransferase SpsG
MIGDFRPDWYVLDLPYPDIDLSYFPVLRHYNCKIFFVDDARFIDPGPDVLLNSSVLAQAMTPLRHPAGTKYLLGPDYFILDEKRLPAPAVMAGGKVNVLLTFGGSDPTGLTRKVLESLLAGAWGQTHFTVVLGPGFREGEAVAALTAARQDDFTVIKNPAALLSLMAASDLTVCAGGRTMYELRCLGKKFLPIASADHEAREIEEFVRLGLVEYGLNQWRAEQFVAALMKMLTGLDLNRGPRAQQEAVAHPTGK